MIDNSLVRKLIACLGVFMVLIPSVHANELRALPDDNLSYPVLYLGAPLKGKMNTGSGFYLGKDNIIYFVTARHVLFYESSTDLKVLPKGLTIPYHLLYRIHYNFEKNKLSFDGVMSEKDKAELIQNTSKEPLFAQAVEQLYKKSQTLQLKDKIANLFSYPKDFSKGESNEIEIQLQKLLSEGKVKYHPNSDVAVVRIGMLVKLESGEQVIRQEDGLKMIKGTGVLGIDAATTLKLFDDVLEGNGVFVFGYPTSISNNNAFLDIKLPLLRKGIVAGKNNKLKTIILDCPTYQGTSGGIVIEVDEKFPNKYFNGIGLITNFIPFTNEGSHETQNSGYSVAVPIDQVLELLKD